MIKCYMLNEKDVGILELALNSLGQRCEYEIKKDSKDTKYKEILTKVETMLQEIQK